MGYPIDTPFMCANNEFINPTKTSCYIPLCDTTILIKYFNGYQLLIIIL